MIENDIEPAVGPKAPKGPITTTSLISLKNNNSTLIPKTVPLPNK